MEYMQENDKNQLFQELISQFLDKIKKNIPKKYSKIKDIIVMLQEKLNQNDTNANKFFILIKLSIETKISKLIDISLYYMQKLIQGNFFQELAFEKLFSVNDDQSFYNENSQQIFLAIIDTLCQSSNEKDENIQLLVINTSSAIIENYKVNGIQLIKLFRVCIHINSLTKNQIIQNQAKSALFQMINIIYQKLTQSDEPEIVNQQSDDQIQDIIIECINEAHYEVQQKNIIMQRQKSFDNMINIFDNLCKLSSKDQNFAELNPYTLKSKVITLELILKILDSPNNIFFHNVKIIYLLKECLCDTLLKNALCQEKQVFVQSFNIFVFLVQNFREHLKIEIATFIETVFLKILDSFNSSFNHIIFSLQVLEKILQNPQATLEFYVNYDCTEDSPFIIQKIIDLLIKIAQGKYAKTQFQTTIQSHQELVLKKLAIKTLVNLIKGLKNFHEELIGQEKQKMNLKTNNIETEESIIIEQEQTLEDVKYEEFEKKRIIKIQISQAIKKFNFKPKAGLKHMIELGVIIQNDSKSLALFIYKNNSNFSKQQLGEFFGDENPFNVNVLSDFTEMLDLQNMNIDEAMRHYLQYFQLPGEGQKVDRVMQHFAQKFYKDNPDSVFTHADAAYTLSYLMMMLQTELHNPQVEKPMTLEQFKKLAQGINNGSDLPAEYMQQLYISIGKKQLALHEKEEAKIAMNEALNSSLRKKQDLFLAESEKMLKIGQKKLKTSQESIFIKVQTDEYIKPVLQICSFPLLATCSQIFNEQEDAQVIQMILDCFQDIIQLTSYFNLNTERDALVISLTNQCVFNNKVEIKDKHIQCIQTILNVANFYGNDLKDSWYYILLFLSKFDNLYNLYSTKSEINVIQSKNAEFLFQIIDHSEIDIIFNNSVKLNTDAILDFIGQLTIMSKEELNGKNPVLFGLQKVVEMADLNMSRIKIIWTKIWDLIKEHFKYVGCHENIQISMYAIDSLKQLSVKFLKKGEMNHFQGQRDFLQPFQSIYQSVQRNQLEIKDFILCCLQYICQYCNQDIKSGWKVILNIVNCCLNDDNEKLIQISFNILVRMLSENFSSLHDLFIDIVLTLIQFLKIRDQDIIIASIDNIFKVISNINKLMQNEIEQKSNKAQEYEKILQQIWMPILNNLVGLFNDSRREVQTKSIESLFLIIKEYGHLFLKEFWIMIVKGVFKSLFDEIQYSFQNSKTLQIQNIRNVSTLAFSSLSEIFNLYYEDFIKIYSNVLDILFNCIESLTLQLAQLSINCFKQIIINNGKLFTDTQWDITVTYIKKILQKTHPKQLLQFQEGDKKIHGEKCLTQCTVQLLSIQLIRQICESHFNFMSKQNIDDLLNETTNCLNIARNFNVQIQKRYQLWKSGFLLEVKLLPGLNKQEQESLLTFIQIKFKQYEQTKEKQNLQEFIKHTFDVFQIFVQRNEKFIQYKKFNEQIKDTDPIDLIIQKLQFKELERDIINMKQVIFDMILDLLQKIPIQDLRDDFKQLTFYLLKIQENQFHNKYLFENTVTNQASSWEKIRIFIENILQNLMQ